MILSEGLLRSYRLVGKIIEAAKVFKEALEMLKRLQKLRRLCIVARELLMLFLGF